MTLFKNTRDAFQIIIKDLRLAFRVLTVVTNLCYIGYLTLAISLDIGLLGFNVALLALTVGGFLFYIIIEFTDNKALDDGYKRARPWIRYTKLAVNMISLAVSVYGIVFIDSTSVPVYVQILTVLNVILWVIRFIIEVVLVYVKSRWQLLADAFAKDVQPITKAYNGVVNLKNDVAIGVVTVKNAVVSRTVKIKNGISNAFDRVLHRHSGVEGDTAQNEASEYSGDDDKDKAFLK